MTPAEFFRGFPSPPRRFVQTETPAARLTGSSAFRQTRQTTGDTPRVLAAEVEAYSGGT